MGHSKIEKHWCDTCYKEYSSDGKLYHNHGRYTGGGELATLTSRLKNSENEDEKFAELCDHFGIKLKGTSNFRWAIYDEDIIKCIIKGMREGKIHKEADCECECSAWYMSASDCADYIESKISDIKDAYNNFVKRVMEEEKKNSDYRVNSLEDQLIK
jgi:hypothetical protein